MRSFLGRHWFLILLTAGVGFTLSAPQVMHGATDFWEPRRTVAVSLFLIAWTMPTHSLLAELGHPAASLWAIVLSYGFVPVGAWALGQLVQDDNVAVGLILISAVPCTLSSAVLWTRLAGGNEATALLTVTGTTFTSWFLTTAWLSLLTRTKVQLDVPAMMGDLVLSLILPVVAGQALRLIPACLRFADRRRVALAVLAQLFVVAILLKASVTANVPRILWQSILLTVLLHVAALLGGLFSCRWLGFDRGRQIAVAFSCSQKTLQVSLVLYEQYFRDDFPYAVMPLLFYHMGQLMLDTLIAKRLHDAAPVDQAT
jgi:sodium/bile acid cotransporter 7